MKHFLLFFAALLPLAAEAQVPTITAFNPTRNAIAVPRTAPISVTLSQPVGTGAVRVFSAQRGGRLAGTATATGNTLNFTPQQPLQPGEVLAVTVPTSIKSSAGTALAAAQVYQFTAAATGGTGTFAASPAVALGGNPRRLVTTDVDGDGDLDLLAPNPAANPGSVHVRLNNGQGSFVASPNLVVGDSVVAIALADLDGDGDNDLVSCSNSRSIGSGNSGSGSIIVRLNNGQGVFGSGSSYSSNYRTDEVMAGDVDGDGDLDLLVMQPPSRNGGSMSYVLLNNGVGTFAHSGSALSNLGVQALADIDGDGMLDLVTRAISASFTEGMGWHRSNGNGNFVLQGVFITTDARVTDISLADVDGDGGLDLLAAGSTGISRVLNQNGSFSSYALLPGTSSPRVADLDGDGDLDVYTTSAATGTLNIGFNIGNGVFTGGYSQVVAPGLDNATTADLDGDGDLDLLATSSSSPDVQVLLNQNGTSLTVTSQTPARNLRNASRAGNVAISFNQPPDNAPATTAALRVFANRRGGRLAGTATVAGSTLTFDPGNDFQPGEQVDVSLTTDVRSGNARLARPQVFQFTAAVSGGVGTFGGGSTVGIGRFPTHVVTADIDNDGDLDALTISAPAGGASEVGISRNNGNGTFQTTTYLGAGNDANGLTVGDMNGDGSIDIVLSYGIGYSSARVYILFNDGRGNFGTGTTILMSIRTNGVAVGDVDGDGDLDVAALSSYSTASISLNNGSGSFGLATPVNVGGFGYNLALRDTDNDGDLDLVAALGGQVAICRNNSLGTFGPATLVAMPSAHELALADLNGDGSPDLLTTNGAQVDVRLNDGTGAFGAISSLTVPISAGTSYGLAVGDVDSDGDLDLIVGGGSLSGIMSVRLNDGAGNFGGGYDPVVAPGLLMPGPTTLADVDGDGDLDLLVGFHNASTLRVLLNQVTPTITAFAPASGVVGSTVTITGTNLNGATSVVLNGVPATNFTVASSTSITFVVPPGATSGPITVTTPLGTATSTSFAVIPFAPTLTVLSPATTAAGTPGLWLTLTGTNFTTQTQVTFNGFQFSKVFVSSSQLMVQVPFSSLQTPGTYRVAVTTPAPGGGTATLNFVVTQTTPSQTAAASPELVLYPNPTHGSFMLRLSGLTANQFDGTAALTNSLGQQVGQAQLRASAQAWEATVPVGQLPPGLYLLRVRTSTGTLTRQVSVE